MIHIDYTNMLAPTVSGGVPQADWEKADALFAEAAKLSAGTEQAARLGAPVFEKERLQVGMEVPEVAGEDPDGVAFKLSDYRGKVVLLDFYGFW